MGESLHIEVNYVVCELESFDVFDHETLVEDKRRFAELLEKCYLVFDEADELQALAKDLGKQIIWQHKMLDSVYVTPGGDVIPWEDGRGNTTVYGARR